MQFNTSARDLRPKLQQVNKYAHTHTGGGGNFRQKLWTQNMREKKSALDLKTQGLRQCDVIQVPHFHQDFIQQMCCFDKGSINVLYQCSVFSLTFFVSPKYAFPCPTELTHSSERSNADQKKNFNK